MKIHRYVWPAMQGAGIALIFVIVLAGVAYLVMPPASPSSVCARTNEFGSSAWVACVDKLIQEPRP